MNERPGRLGQTALASFDRYLQIRVAYQPSFSPDGLRVAFLTNITGIPQVWCVDAQGGWPQQLTFGEDRVLRAAYSPVRDQIAFSRDVGGNERAQIWIVQGNGTGERRLTWNDEAMHTFGGWSRDGGRIAFSANRRDPGLFDVYVQDVDSGEARMVWRNETPGIVTPAEFSADGTRLLVLFAHGSTSHDLFEIDVPDGQVRHLTPHSGDVRYGYPAYAPTGEAVLCVCDEETDLAGVVCIDRKTLAVTPLVSPPTEVEFLGVAYEAGRLAWVLNEDGIHRLQAMALSSGEQWSLTGLPAGVISPRDFSPPVFSPDGRWLVFAHGSSCRTTDIWIWEPEADRLWAVTQSSHAGVPEASFVTPELVRYRSFDGREIPAWLYSPQVGSQPWPVILHIHGGPEAQHQPQFFPEIHYFVSRRFAVLAPNVRGSSGYGKVYSHLDDVDKRMDSVADLAYAAAWIGQQSRFDPKRIAVYGGSYGGFMVLAAMTRDPDLWAAGVEICGISNFVSFLENTGPYRRSAREREYGSLQHDRELLESISPIHRIDRLRAPLMVVHGANDPRVPLGEAEQVVEALRRRRVPVEFLVYPDEGHGLVKLTNKLDAYPKIAAFLERHLAPS